MPVCHRFKNFQPQGLELSYLQFKQTQQRLHPPVTSDWVTLQKHPKIWRKKIKISFSPSPLRCLKMIKKAILLQHWPFARSPSLKQANSRTSASLPFLSKGRGEHNCTFAAKQHQQKYPKNSPMSPSPETQKLNHSLQHYSGETLLSRSRKEPRGKGCVTQHQGWGPRTSGGDFH